MYERRRSGYRFSAKPPLMNRSMKERNRVPLSSDKLSHMKGYCFTFGGYRRLDRIDRAKNPFIHSVRMKNVYRVKCCLDGEIFGIDGIMCIVRDYLPGGALLPIDLFPSRDVDSNEIYQILYSVSCCNICTQDVIEATKGFSPSIQSLGISEAQRIHLVARCDLLGNKNGLKGFSKHYNTEVNSSYKKMIQNTSIYRKLRSLIFRPGYITSVSSVVLRGISLRVNETHLGRILNGQHHINEIDIDSVSLLGRRRDMRTMRKKLGRDRYYGFIRQSVHRASYIRSLPENTALGLEERIILSMETHNLTLREEGEDILIRLYLYDLWELPSSLLRGGCNVRKEIDYPDRQMFILFYEGKEYNVVVERRNNPPRIIYTCGNGTEFSYFTLLFIIAHRFLFTYDRGYLIRILRMRCEPSDKVLEYLSTPSTHPPIHDLICPPSLFPLPSF